MTTSPCIKSVNRSALTAFSPHAPLLATGTRAGVVDLSFSSSSYLEIFKVDFSSDDRELVLCGGISCSESFNRLSWSESVSGLEEFEFGVVAGGLADGDIGVWNPKLLIRFCSCAREMLSNKVVVVQVVSGQLCEIFEDIVRLLVAFKKINSPLGTCETQLAASISLFLALCKTHCYSLSLISPEKSKCALVQQLSRHKGPVRGLEFSSLKPNLLASSGEEGEILIWDLAKPTEPTHFPPLKTSPQGGGSATHGEISFLTWNKRVEPILASTSSHGATVIWDLRKQKPIISFADSVRRRCSVLQWNPDVATQIIVASDDDNSPPLRIWDMRNTMSPVRELVGHTK
ncbi:WD40/YVTN repeat-like-containing domain, ancestral coatomer element 1, Sec16/Sec31, partial [Tanacetum coccineum]